MNDRPTPMTDANRKRICGNWDHQGDHVREFVPADVCAGIERQLAAKTEECEGWEKQWREAAINALTDKTRDELAEARAVTRKMELAIQHHEKRADNALSDLREADSRTVRALHERNEAREQRDNLAEALGKIRNMTRADQRCAICTEVYHTSNASLATLNQTTQ